MKNPKRVLSLITAVLMLFSVAACGETEEWVYSDVEEVVQTEVEGDTTSGPISSTATKKKKKVKKTQIEDKGLISMTKYTPQEELLKKQNLKGTTLKIVVGAEDQVDKYPQEAFARKMLTEKWGINVEQVIYSNTQRPSSAPTLVSCGNPPDVAHAATTNLMRYVYNNLASSVDKYIEKSDPVWENGDAFDGYVYNGKIYGVNWNGRLESSFFIWYNSTYFKEKKLDDPYTLYKNGKWTVDKFKELALAATTYKSSGETDIYGVRTWDYSVFLAMYGATGITENSNGKWEVTIDSANSMKGLQLISDLSNKGAVTFTLGGEGFLNRKFAMHIERPKNAIGNLDAYNKMDDEIGLVPLPQASDGKYYNYCVSDGSFFFKNGKNPAGAVAYRYYDRLFKRHSSIEEQKAAGFDPYEEIFISSEHENIANDYFKKSTKPVSDMIYTLNNWYSGDKLQLAFWNSITIDGKQPAQVVDSTKSQLLKCLKETVGVGNVVS